MLSQQKLVPGWTLQNKCSMPPCMAWEELLSQVCYQYAQLTLTLVNKPFFQYSYWLDVSHDLLFIDSQCQLSEPDSAYFLALTCNSTCLITLKSGSHALLMTRIICRNVEFFNKTVLIEKQTNCLKMPIFWHNDVKCFVICYTQWTVDINKPKVN